MPLEPEELARIEILESRVARIASAVIPPGFLNGDVTGPMAATVLSAVASLAGGGNQLVGVNNAGAIIPGVVPPPGPLAMGGDVTGTTAASILSQIAALAGGGIRFVGIDNLGNVGALALDRPLAGDVTGTLSASVLSAIASLAGGGTRLVQIDNAGAVLAIVPTALAIAGDVTGTLGASVVAQIASLAGGGTVLVAVDNAGNIISGGTAPGTPDPFAFLQTITDNLVASSAVRNYDFDLSVAAFTNKQIRLKARGYATTKDTVGVPGANLTGSAYIVTDAVYQNANGTVSLVTAAAGGAANPMPAVNNEMTLEPQACLGLQSGGFSPPNLAWTLLAATTARLQLTATNNANRGSWEIDVYQRVKAAP